MALSIVITLSINASAQSGLGKDFVVDFTLTFEVDLRFKHIDFVSKSIRNLPFELCLPRCCRCHGFSSDAGLALNQTFGS
jgi:hypothetical protein